MLLFAQIDSLLLIDIICFRDSLSPLVFITDSGLLSTDVIITESYSFLLHAEINRFDSLSSLAVIPGGGSLLPHVIIALADSLCLNVIIPTDDSLCPNAIINRL